ncbi:M1 family peptidase [Ornithobacterium rhinotracheale]|uniref:M1 family metallopeptidase n=1 Tax=Ornithobacterium rhinotracheale TaxID=28251 RepID=UPI00129C17C5|nr:M1 family metallopeptidase [Ornithobacterium rhinotracheale]MRJ07541.1 M1 family peptidase [Ornithobacterium rhinotracheale]UOH78135.1 M1 family metallopeptidase [Ornithobacterium rhinotracheale]
MKKIYAFLWILWSFSAWAQSPWQQKADYKMDIKLNTEKHQYDGKMEVKYINNSPDTLRVVYFHLYYNAFQPGSLMADRLESIVDPDKRMLKNIGTKDSPKMVSGISQLKENEIGFQDIKSVQQNGENLDFKVYGTILKVNLKNPILPKSTQTFNLEWTAQVPKIIRRSGRDTKEGIDYTMTQWYPKLAMYDQNGWNLQEYIGREFYAPFANFDVKITLPAQYIVGASGTLLNEKQVLKSTAKKNKTWHFAIKGIHDFMWAADPSYQIIKQKLVNGPTVYYFYSKDLEPKYLENWKKAREYIPGFFSFMNERFGKYPWDSYTIIQGGDGGMEYGAATAITGQRSLESLVGVIFHEGAHSWFQHLFGINETEQEWFDEGFTSYAETLAFKKVFEKGNPDEVGVAQDAYAGYFNLVRSGMQEPLSTLADYYDTNYAYGISAYYKGQVFVAQLGYVIGEENLRKTFKEFYRRWKFDHPSYKDFVKTAEDISGINLKWYDNMMINTIRVIDYAVAAEGKEVKLVNKSNFAMPLDVLVTYADGSQELFYISINAMRGAKPFEKEYYPNASFTQLKDWGWTKPTYNFSTEKEIQKVEIDPTHRLADVDLSNNTWTK